MNIVELIVYILAAFCFLLAGYIARREPTALAYLGLALVTIALAIGHLGLAR